MPEQNKSEVARLLNLIQKEYEAGVNGLTGLAQGTARHSFITASMENMGKLQEQLDELVGEGAIVLVIQALESSPEQKTISNF